LVAAGKASDFVEGVALAAVSIDSGAAKQKLADLVRFTTSSRTVAGQTSSSTA
jgi:anthranilate phosphoribosyltransferase